MELFSPRYLSLPEADQAFKADLALCERERLKALVREVAAANPDATSDGWAQTIQELEALRDTVLALMERGGG